jgi:hypothetical protein
MGSLSAILNEAKQARNDSLPAQEIIEKIYSGYMEEDSYKQKKGFAPSGLFYGSGACARRWVLSFQGNLYETKAGPLEFARMKAGTKSHERIEEAIAKSGVAKEIELELHSEDPPIHAYADAVIDFNEVVYVGEIKTTTHENFEYRRNTNKIADYHLGQLLVCMRLAKIDKGLLIYESTKTNEMHGIIVDMTEIHSQYVDAIMEWCREVWTMYQENILPHRSFRKGTKVCSKCPVEVACDNGPLGDQFMRKLPML